MKYYQMFFKEEFIENVLSENEKGLANPVFVKSKELEDSFEKDLYDFTGDEIELLLFSFNSANIATINTYVNILRKYTDYAISHGRKTSNINLYRTFRYNDFEKYLAKHKLKYFEREDFLNIISEVYNPQDYATCLALFDGIAGADYSEFTNMTIEHLRQAEKVEDGYDIELIETDSEGNTTTRINTISNETFKALESAFKADTYYAKNGSAESINRQMPVVEGKHVFRNAGLKKNVAEQVDHQFVYRKISVVAKATEKTITSTTTIINSGIIYYLAKYSKDNVASYETAETVIKKFGKSINANSPSSSFKAFLNKHQDALLKIYGVEVEI